MRVCTAPATLKTQQQQQQLERFAFYIRPSTSIQPSSSCGGTFEPLFPAAEDHYYVNSGRLWCSCKRQLASPTTMVMEGELVCVRDVTRHIRSRSRLVFQFTTNERILVWTFLTDHKSAKKFKTSARTFLWCPDGHVPPKYHGNRAINFIVGLLW